MSKRKERYWTFVLYPESAPEDWKEYLQQTGVQWAISPLHDKDKNPDGELKKAHYHIVGFWSGPTTYERVYEITQDLNCPIPQRVMQPIGAIRYLTHKDNPEKYQYDEKDIQCINGLDLADINGLTKTMVEDLKRAIVHLARDLKITEYSSMYDWLDENDMRDMMDVFSNHTMFFNAYFKSKHFREIQKELTKDTLNDRIKSR